jgi:hypothetical protein
VTISTAGGWRTVKCASVIAAYVVSHSHTLLMLVAIPMVLAYQLLRERARRKTLVAIIECAPGGTVVVVEDGLGGATMRLRVGDKLLPPPGGSR